MTRPTVEFTPVEGALATHLTATRGVECATETREDEPRFILLIGLGSTRNGPATEQSMITFLCSAPTKAEAEHLARDVRADIHALSELAGRPVYEIQDVGGPASDPDPDSGAPAYRYTALITTRLIERTAP